MKAKILLHNYGNARLSKKAIELYLQRKSLTAVGNGELIHNLEENEYDPLDATLIQVVEELGVEADSFCERFEKELWTSEFHIDEIDNERDFTILYNQELDFQEIFYKDAIDWLTLKSSKNNEEVCILGLGKVKCNREFSIFYFGSELYERIIYKDELSWVKANI